MILRLVLISTAATTLELSICPFPVMDTSAFNLSGIDLNLSPSQRLAAEYEIEHTGLISLLQFKVCVAVGQDRRVSLTALVGFRLYLGSFSALPASVSSAASFFV